MAEELHNPARNVPIAMVGSVAVNGLLGLVYCIVLLFCLGDLDELLATTTGFPFMQLFLNSTNSRAGASVLSILVSLMAVAGAFAGLLSTSRTAWAFARDGGMPFSEYFAHIDTKHQVPVRMCILLTALQALLGLIYVGNTTAFNAILSMAILGMYTSYVLPIAYMVVYGRSPSPHRTVRFGPFRLGKWGVVVNIVALLWGTLAMLFSMFPSFQPVSLGNMNYSSVVMGGWVLVGVAYYFGFQRKTYEGPSDLPVDMVLY
jgi:choline transport protein